MSIFGQILEYYGNQQLQNQQQRYNREMYQQQLQDNIMLWNMQNQYNAPAADMQRKIDAGINPLFDGSSSAAAPVSGAQPMPYERASMPHLTNPIMDFLDAKRQLAQIGNIQADTALKSNISLTEEQKRENYIKEREQMDANIKKLLSSSSLTDAEKQKVEQFMNYADSIYQSQIDINESTKDLNDAHKQRIRELLSGEKELQNMNIKDFREKWKRWSAEIDHLAKEDAVLEKQAKYYLISLLNNGFANTGFSLNNMLISALIDDDLELDADLRNTLEKVVSGRSSDVPRINKKLKRGVSSGQWSSSFSNNTLVPD